MKFEGRLTRDGRHWLADIPAFDAMTQGRTKREALAMVEDLVRTMAGVPRLGVSVESTGRASFEVGSNRLDVMIGLLLRRQRERQGLTLAQAAARLGQRSPNAYARYEQGRAMPTVEKLEQLLEAVAPGQRLVWRFAA